MNYLTKEELEIILEGVQWRDNHVHSNERPEKLTCKIKSMIDNYCEHANTGQDYSCNRCWDCGYCW
jgi:hypothetical protein